jgi:hypothetical protein
MSHNTKKKIKTIPFKKKQPKNDFSNRKKNQSEQSTTQTLANGITQEVA